MRDLIDEGAVAAWLAKQGVTVEEDLTATRLTGGQSNPTFLLQTGGHRYVLRRKPPGQLLKSAHAVDREFRVMRALRDTDVPVPDMIALCEDETVTGAMFYVMAHVEGRTFDDPRVPEVERAERASIYTALSRVLAAIHSVDVASVGLSDFGPEGDYFARQIGRWTKQYRASETDPIPEMDALIDWLHDNTPEDDGRRTLVHGDYRIDNLLFAPTGPTPVAVLDWELSTLGHPFADLAALLMQWRMPTGDEGRGLAGVDRAALGIPSDAQFVAQYADRMGIADMPAMNFYLAFAFFRMGAILQGVKKRALDGNASDPERGLKLGAYVPEFARQGLAAAKDG
ncbi:phosphotransferase family protein [Palleronia abyssalis]|uniref:Aminoglycoside phosphotransferase n=1 Tax=Palleronia abyssalis TaxID=1501240 RepID=A0A2R8BYD4_9RHOB|nr:phosphotransferase family protein [Palleronia abyssalis]SPJ25139.1 Putative aminoglycoside phosphotransferase [Palleronia abyssalis]